MAQTATQEAGILPWPARIESDIRNAASAGMMQRFQEMEKALAFLVLKEAEREKREQEALATPASSVVDTQYPLDDTSPTSPVPWPGKTFIIQHRGKIRGKYRSLTLVRGQLCLRPTIREDRGAHWECIEKDGWLGFRNVVSGTYLGRNHANEILADAQQHQEWQYICPKNHEQGGYMLYTVHGLRLFKICMNTRNQFVEKEDEDALVWDFYQV